MLLKSFFCRPVLAINMQTVNQNKEISKLLFDFSSRIIGKYIKETQC